MIASILQQVWLHPGATAWDVACLLKQPERAGSISALMGQLVKQGLLRRFKIKSKPHRGFCHSPGDLLMSRKTRRLYGLKAHKRG